MNELAFIPVDVAVITVSDTRTAETDRSGAVIVERLEQAGHEIAWRSIIKDEVDIIRAQLARAIEDPQVRVALVTGGTGMAVRDVTPEALAPLVTKPIPGFGELFRWISYEEIGISTIQSRAEGAMCGDTLVFLLPGSPGACKTAMDKILIPQLDARHRPCNFVELLGLGVERGGR